MRCGSRLQGSAGRAGKVRSSARCRCRRLGGSWDSIIPPVRPGAFATEEPRQHEHCPKVREQGWRFPGQGRRCAGQGDLPPMAQVGTGAGVVPACCRCSRVALRRSWWGLSGVCGGQRWGWCCSERSCVGYLLSRFGIAGPEQQVCSPVPGCCRHGMEHERGGIRSGAERGCVPWGSWGSGGGLSGGWLRSSLLRTAPAPSCRGDAPGWAPSLCSAPSRSLCDLELQTLKRQEHQCCVSSLPDFLCVWSQIVAPDAAWSTSSLCWRPGGAHGVHGCGPSQTCWCL